MQHSFKRWFEVHSEDTLIKQKGGALLVMFASFAVLTLCYVPYVLFMPSYAGRQFTFMVLILVVEFLYLGWMALCRRGYLDASITMIMVTIGCGVIANSVPMGALKPSMYALVMLNLLGCFAERRRQLLFNVVWSWGVLVALWLGLSSVVEEVKLLNDELIRAACLIAVNSYLARELAQVHTAVVREYEGRRDLTRQKMEEVQQQRELAELESQRAEHASLMKGEFLANISHELRTPLNAILGYSEMLYEEFSEREDAPASLVQDTTRVHVAGRHLLELIQDVLNLSDIESGELKMKVRSFNLDELCEEVMHSMELAAMMQHSSLQVLGGGVGEVCSDPVWVRQVLFNMLSNAVKFTRDGEILVRTGVRADDGKVFVEVEDTGIGMTEQEQERVFEEFVQANAQTLREFGGTGLGLALCYKLAREMDGGLTIQSVKGEGTRVMFFFAPSASEVRS